MGKLLSLGGPRTVRLQRIKFAIGWDVPVKVAVVWDEKYETMRAGTIFELWGMAHGFATGSPSVSLSPIDEIFEAEDGHEYRKAYAECMTFNLNEVPAHLHEEARIFCNDHFEMPVIEYSVMAPVTAQDYDGGESPE